MTPDVEATARALLPVIAAAVEPATVEDAVELLDDLDDREFRWAARFIDPEITRSELRAALECGLIDPDVFRANVGVRRALEPLVRRELMRVVP